MTGIFSALVSLDNIVFVRLNIFLLFAGTLYIRLCTLVIAVFFHVVVRFIFAGGEIIFAF